MVHRCYLFLTPPQVWGVLIDSDVDVAYVLLYSLLGKCALLRRWQKFVATLSCRQSTAATTSLKKKTKEKLNLCRARFTCFNFSELNRKLEMHFSRLLKNPLRTVVLNGLHVHVQILTKSTYRAGNKAIRVRMRRRPHCLLTPPKPVEVSRTGSICEPYQTPFRGGALLQAIAPLRENRVWPRESAFALS